MSKSDELTVSNVMHNVIIGLTVSFVALSLGVAFGVLSGRGAYAGMISAGLIALVTSAFGGTRLQCSGPTAPMSAVSAIIIAMAVEKYAADIANQFITMVFLLAGALIILIGLLRLGRFIKLVPNVVISGFMSGIAVLIVVSQLQLLLGWGGKQALQGDFVSNVVIVFATLLISFGFTPMLNKISKTLSYYLPATLVAIVVVSGVAHWCGGGVELIQVEQSLDSWSEFTGIVASQWPKDWSLTIVLLALPFALQLAALCYLDTLLTSLVVDRMTKEPTAQNKELISQGVANSLAAIVGGIPGAQATIRSVLLVNEGATMRIAGICVGAFVLIEMLLFIDVINLIPKAVFMGVLLKVGYEVFDFSPFRAYISDVLARKKMSVSSLEIMLVVGTIVVTVLVDLNIAVIGFTILFYMLKRYYSISDLAGSDDTKEK